MRVALIAHDKKKDEMVNFAKTNEERLSYLELYTTGTTGLRIMENTNLQVHRLKSGPLGGDQQIGALVSEQKLDLVIFLRDPLTSQPHEPDINALLRLCDVYAIPLATNVSTAQLVLDALHK
ncbi:methylglyoxal synthase [Clostridioides difficile]